MPAELQRRREGCARRVGARNGQLRLQAAAERERPRVEQAERGLTPREAGNRIKEGRRAANTPKGRVGSQPEAEGGAVVRNAIARGRGRAAQTSAAVVTWKAPHPDGCRRQDASYPGHRERGRSPATADSDVATWKAQRGTLNAGISKAWATRSNARRVRAPVDRTASGESAI